MAILHNRLCKADFFSDPDLLSLPRDVRSLYRDLWHVAEDSGCLEDSPFGWKIVLYPSPLDADVTVERLAEWRDALVDAGKLIPYAVDGKSYLFLANFFRHQTLFNPKRNELPLPPWVTLGEHPTDNRKRFYRITGPLPDTTDRSCGDLPQDLRNGSARLEQRCRKTRTEPNRKRRRTRSREEEQDLLSTAGAADQMESPDEDDFDLFWGTYPRREGSKKAARRAYRGLSATKRKLALDVARAMQDLIARGQGPEAKRFIPLPTTFIRGEAWDGWSDGPPANWQRPTVSGPRPATNSYADELTDYDREFLSGSYGEPTEGAS